MDDETFDETFDEKFDEKVQDEVRRQCNAHREQLGLPPVPDAIMYDCRECRGEPDCPVVDQ